MSPVRGEDLQRGGRLQRDGDRAAQHAALRGALPAAGHLHQPHGHLRQVLPPQRGRGALQTGAG